MKLSVQLSLTFQFHTLIYTQPTNGMIHNTIIKKGYQFVVYNGVHILIHPDFINTMVAVETSPGGKIILVQTSDHTLNIN
jgi:hypothetical protein